jgi:hypothetical protein
MAVLRQGEPKLKGVFAQHGLKGKGRAVIHALRVVMRNLRYKFSPQHHTRQLFHEVGIAGFL